MAESEIAEKITKVIKKSDKLVRNVKKGIAEVIEAVQELKGVKPQNNHTDNTKEKSKE